MNEMQLKEYNYERVVYLYTPSGKGTPGEIVYIFRDKEAKVLKSAENDSPTSANHAVLAVEKRVNANNLPIRFIDAWY